MQFVLSKVVHRMGPVSAYLPGVEVNHDQQGGSSRMRLSHCTSGRLTPTMVSNVDHLNAQFLLVGDCVRAIPWLKFKRTHTLSMENYFQPATFIASCWQILLRTVPMSGWRISLVDSVCLGCLKRQANLAWFTSSRGVYPCLDLDPVFLSAGAKMLHWSMDLWISDIV